MEGQALAEGELGSREFVERSNLEEGELVEPPP